MLDNPVPVLTHYLQQLDKLLQKVAASEISEAEILDARIAPDMLPFADQVRTTANFALRITFPLAGLPLPDSAPTSDTLSGLRQQISHTLESLHAVKLTDFIEVDYRFIQDKAGFAELNMSAEEYLYHYALPNFYFHLSMVFAIARGQGVALGKADFDGYHQYPAGFSFEH